MPLPRKRKRKTLSPLETFDLDEEQIARIAWNIDQLVKGGFDVFWAGRIAAIPQLDWRDAVKLRKRGCTQELVEEILR